MKQTGKGFDMILDSWSMALVTASGFIMGVVDGAIGMGYGTMLAPVLLMVGFDPLRIVPAVLFSQLTGGLLASFFHHRFKNVNFSVREEHLRLAVFLGVLSAAGAVLSVLVATNLPKLYLSLYIGVLATVLGLIVWATRNKRYDFSWPKMMFIGFLAAFNKGLSGGGYGPIVTAGQIMSGVEEKSAVGITSLSEALISLIAVITHIWTTGNLDWVLTSCLSVSVLLSAPIAAYMTKRIESGKLKLLISLATSLLGFSTILKVTLS